MKNEDKEKSPHEEAEIKAKSAKEKNDLQKRLQSAMFKLIEKSKDDKKNL